MQYFPGAFRGWTEAKYFGGLGFLMYLSLHLPRESRRKEVFDIRPGDCLKAHNKPPPKQPRALRRRYRLRFLAAPQRETCTHGPVLRRQPHPVFHCCKTPQGCSFSPRSWNFWYFECRFHGRNPFKKINADMEARRGHPCVLAFLSGHPWGGTPTIRFYSRMSAHHAGSDTAGLCENPGLKGSKRIKGNLTHGFSNA